MQDYSVTVSWQPIPRRDDIAYYEILIYEKEAPGTNHTYETNNGDTQTYTAAENLYPGILYIALVRGVANHSDQFKHEGVWSTQQLFSVNGKSNNFVFIRFLDLAHYPVDTGRSLNVHKRFSIRPGRLLNVLCTFTLRPVSMG